MKIRSTVGTAIAVVGLASVSACGGTAEGGSGSGGEDGGTLDLVGFSVLEAVNNEAVPAFQETDAGDGVEFSPSYGSSGDQSRSVEAGKAADFVHLSLEPDMTRVVDSGHVDASWADGPTKGIASQSVVSFVVREGNPKGIDSWDDLTKGDISVITPNPASSGSAKWNLLAAYGQVIAQGGTEKEAEQYVGDLLANAAALPESARDATTIFEGGTGDVLLSYENEAILAIQNGAEFEYVVPDTTLLIENPAAVTTDASEAAQDWLDFVISPEGQAIYAKYGYRPVVDIDPVEVEGANEPSDPFPAPGKLLTVGEDFKGWDEANATYFDEESGVITGLLQASGKG
jgi:sulfate/thiosulfate transport system substrate-binding protein